MKIMDIVTNKLVVDANTKFIITFKVIDGIQDSSGIFITDSKGNNVTTS